MNSPRRSPGDLVALGVARLLRGAADALFGGDEAHRAALMESFAAVPARLAGRSRGWR